MRAGDNRRSAIGSRYLCLRDLEIKKIKINSARIWRNLNTSSKGKCSKLERSEIGAKVRMGSGR
jgi:hypothetical protein